MVVHDFFRDLSELLGFSHVIEGKLLLDSSTLFKE